MIHVLITRLPEDGKFFAEALEDLGILSTSIPLQRVKYYPILSHLDDIQALVFTSKNGLRAFCKSYPQRDFLVYCVGNGTADLAKRTGFKRVYSADGNVNNLANLLRKRAIPNGKTLLHISGKDIRQSVDKLLPEYPIERIVGYEIVDDFELTEESLKLLNNRTISHVCLFSPKSGERFGKVLKKYNCEDSCRKRTCIAFSQDVANVVDSFPWKGLHVLDQPSLATMLEYFHDIRPKDEY